MNEILIRPQCGNITPLIAETLRKCPDDTTIRFEQGRYDFYAEGCLREYFAPACNQSGDKDIVFPLFYKKNIVIDGGSSEFIFYDRVFPIISKKCENIRFENFSVDFSFMRYCLFGIEPKDGGVELIVDDSLYDYSVNEDGNLVFRCGSDSFSSAEKVFFCKQDENRFCFLKAGKTKSCRKELPAASLVCNAEKTENGVFLRYADNNEYSDFVKGEVVINYDEDRANGIFFFDNCKNVKVRNVSIFSGAGMGIIPQLCENIELDRVSIVPGKNEDKKYSTTADGLFFTNCTGEVLIHNCRVTHTMDDAISIHNIYTQAEKILTQTKIAVRNRHQSHAGYNSFFSGDRVVVSDGKSGSEKGVVTVKNSRMGNDTYCATVEFEEDITGIIETGDYLENHFRSPSVIIENNVFDYVPHIRLGSARKICFRNNYFMNSVSVNINDMLEGWYAYGKSDDVVICGNQFINCDCAVFSSVDRPADNNVYHGNVLIFKNLVRECKNGYVLNKIENLAFKNNSYQGVKLEDREIFTDVKNTDTNGLCQLLMRRDSAPFTRTPLPEGYRYFTFRRGGNEEMSMEEYIKAWFRVEPFWNLDEFYFFYNDDRIPEDGHFLILDEKGEVAAHSNVQIDEHRPGTQTVHFVSVAERYRGRKLGYCVSEMVLDYAEKHNCPTLYLTTDEFRMPALKIYLKLGFKPVIGDKSLEERWFPIMRMLGYREYYDKDEKLCELV